MSTWNMRAGRLVLGLAMLAGGVRADEDVDTPEPEEADVEVVIEVVDAEEPEAVAPARPAAPVTAPSRDPVRAPPPVEPTPRPPLAARAGLTLNFQNAPLVDVLQYLSEMGGFVIIQDAPLTGTVSVMSHQPLSADESVDLLNTLLVDKGLVAIRSGRILRIVDRRSALRQPLPVYTGSQPQDIPARDEMATQIIPVRHANASQIIANLTPLLAEGASMSANESSNAIVLTDTRTNARRMAEIIAALDSSISGIAAVRVFPLRHAVAADLARIIQDFFSPTGTQAAGQAQRGPRFTFQRRADGSVTRTAAGEGTDPRASASRVVAAADERTNSVIVSAPENLMAVVEQIVAEVDAPRLASTRPFRLERADATEVAQVIQSVFEGDVTAVPDPRTNTLLIRAAPETLIEVAEMVGRLDASDARTQRVRVVPLEHADAEGVAAILRGMFETPAGTTRTGTAGRTGTTGAATGTGRLTERAARGAETTTTTTTGGRQSPRR